MNTVKVDIDIKASAKDVFRTIKNMKEFPNFMPNVKKVEIVEVSPDGQSQISSWETELEGASFRWKEKDIFNDTKMTIVYKLIEGDIARFEGEWIIAMIDDKTTRVTLIVNYEIGVEIIEEQLGKIVKEKIRANAKSMLEGIKNKLEN